MSDNEWARTPGRLAWAMLPNVVTNNDGAMVTSPSGTSCSSRSSSSNNSTTDNTSSSTDGKECQWWPAILYPSWSYAATKSGLISMGKSGGGGSCNSGDTTKIRFMGCKVAVTCEQMSKNMVPKRVALGHSSVSGKALRPKVVAYFLGGSSSETYFRECPWSAVHVGNLKEYTIENCKKFLSKYSNKNTSHGDGIMNHFDITSCPSLIVAMEEACIVSEQSKYNPRVLLEQISEKNAKTNGNNKDKDDTTQKRNCKRKRDDDNDKYNNNKSKVSIGKASISAHDEKDITKKLTPECFDDWRLGGNTQRNGGTQSQFAFTAGTIT